MRNPQFSLLHILLLHLFVFICTICGGCGKQICYDSCFDKHDENIKECKKKKTPYKEKCEYDAEQEGGKCILMCENPSSSENGGADETESSSFPKDPTTSTSGTTNIFE